MKKIRNFFSKYYKLILYGAMCGLAFAPTFLFFTFFFSFRFLLQNLFKNFKNNREIFLTGFVWGYGYFLVSFYWLVNPLLFDFPKYVIFIPIALLLIPSFLACYMGIIFIVTYKLKQHFLIENKFVISVIFSLLWTIFELCKSYLFFPFPFNLISYSLGFSTLLIQTVSLFGSYVFGFFVVIIYCGYFIFDGEKKNKYNIIVYTGLCLFILIFGIVKSFEEKKHKQIFNINVRLIQSNFDENTKNDREKADFVMKELKKDINEASDGVDITFLSESAFPFIIGDKYYNNINLGDDNTVMSGAVRVEKGQIFNSIILLRNNFIVDWYDKYYLVPFGEYLPLRKFLPSFVNSFIGIDFSRGNKNKNMIEIEGIGKISPVICYEVLFSDGINKNADLIVNLTNDIWLGNSSGAYQHFNALKFRAVENRMPAIRVSNNGISGYINEYGRIIKKTKLNQKDILNLRI
jgi:apolipoprotein N-acyltransferase